MPRKPMIPAVVPRAAAGDKGLAVKDGLREVRFNVKHGARKLMQAVEAATQDDPAAHGPLAHLGKPLNLAVRTAASLLSNVEHAAVDLLAPDGDYRSKKVPLHSSATYFDFAGRLNDPHGFTSDHHWRYRHWLAQKERTDVFVHEQAIALAGARVADAAIVASSGLLDDGNSAAERRRQTLATLVQALTGSDLLSKPALSPEDAPEELTALVEYGSVVIVLAGEIADRLQHPGGPDGYTGALQLADEIVLADPSAWRDALHGRVSLTAIGSWFEFVLRHL